jgi:nucleoside-diphosphate-sugar epimerase
MIVVTGAAGRLGKRVAQRLTDEGFQLTGISTVPD